MPSLTLKNKNKNIHKERSKPLQPLVIGNTVSWVLYRLFYLIFKLVNSPVILTNTVWPPIFQYSIQVLLACWLPVFPPSGQLLPTCEATYISILYPVLAAGFSTLYPDAAQLCGRLYLNPLSRCCTPVGTSIFQFSLQVRPTCVATYFSTLYPDAAHQFGNLHFNHISRYCPPLWPPCSLLFAYHTIQVLHAWQAHVNIQVLPNCMPT